MILAGFVLGVLVLAGVTRDQEAREGWAILAAILSVALCVWVIAS